jgi:hypothetical protein
MVVKFTYNISKVFNNAGFLVERGESFVLAQLYRGIRVWGGQPQGAASP